MKVALIYCIRTFVYNSRYYASHWGESSSLCAMKHDQAKELRLGWLLCQAIP